MVCEYSFDWYGYWRGAIVTAIWLSSSYLFYRIKMKILQSALRGYAVLGLGQHKSTQKYPLNKENLQTLIILCIAISSTSVYLFHEAKTFQDYTVSVYTSSSVIHGFVGYVIFIWKNQPICELIENVQKALNESEFDIESMYSNWPSWYQ